MSACVPCDGTGVLAWEDVPDDALTDTCPSCGGSGEAAEPSEVEGTTGE